MSEGSGTYVRMRNQSSVGRVGGGWVIFVNFAWVGMRTWEGNMTFEQKLAKSYHVAIVLCPTFGVTKTVGTSLPDAYGVLWTRVLVAHVT